MEDQMFVDGAGHFVGQLRRRGVKLWQEGGRLHFQAPTNVLTVSDISSMRLQKAAILSYLNAQPGSTGTEAPLGANSSQTQFPLGFAQRWALSRWEMGRLRYREVCTTTRLTGQLNLELLRASLLELVGRHEALRTRIITVGDKSLQEVSASSHCDFDVVDLTTVPAALADTQSQLIAARLLNTPIDPAADPLFIARVLRLSESDAVLIIAVDHLLSDAASTCIQLKEIFTAYSQLMLGRMTALPKVPLQFGDYVVWQRDTTLSWTQSHGPFWKRKLEGMTRIRVFHESVHTRTGRSKRAAHAISFEEREIDELRQLSHRQNSSLALTFASIYSALLSRCCHLNEFVLPFLTMGRHSPEVENTVGLFVCPLFLRVELRDGDSFLDLLARVTDEYRAAYEHHDFGRVAGDAPPPDFRLNPSFNWIPERLHANSQSFLDELASSVRGLRDIVQLSPFPIELSEERVEYDIEMHNEPVLALSDRQADLSGAIVYLEKTVSAHAIRNFANSLHALTKAMATNPQTVICTVPLAVP